MKRALLILFAYLALASVQIAHAIDIFLLGGQSNMVGQGTNNQSYTGNALLLTRANTIITLVDPSGDNSVSIYPVYTGNAFGSCVPAMATFLDAHVPTRFMFVHVSLDGCSITNMMPG
ncbi:MAG TPA: hypothetical protein VFC07_12505, partial [Verrucomicrobiae bacterium]|nr:hypothetical protein [Verrucomicrobiae bacterium]